METLKSTYRPHNLSQFGFYHSFLCFSVSGIAGKHLEKEKVKMESTLKKKKGEHENRLKGLYKMCHYVAASIFFIKKKKINLD